MVDIDIGVGQRGDDESNDEQITRIDQYREDDEDDEVEDEKNSEEDDGEDKDDYMNYEYWMLNENSN